MPQAPIADKITVDEINEKIGNNSQTGGGSTLFNGLEKVDGNIGQCSDTAQTSVGITFSLMSYAKGILSLIGLTTAAAGTGSVFARLRQIYEFTTKGGALPTKYNQVAFMQGAAVTNQWYTALNVTGGGGILHFVITGISNTEIRITIDGVPYTFVPPAGMRQLGQANTCSLFPNVRFTSSLVVELRATSGTGPIQLQADYGLF